MSIAARVSQEMGVKLGHEVCGVCYYSQSLFFTRFSLLSVGLYAFSHHALYGVIFTLSLRLLLVELGTHAHTF
jgi:hypothetical protein